MKRTIHAVRQPEEKGHHIASAPISKHGFSSPGCGGKILKDSSPPICGNLSFICGLFFSVLCLFAWSACAQSVNYDIAGSLRYDFFHEGKVGRSITNEFQVKVRGKSTHISSWGIPEHGIVRVKSYEHITDGVTSAFVTIFDVDQAEVEKSQTATMRERYDRAVMLYNGQLPPNHIGLMGPVWLAAASSSYFLGKAKTSSDMWPLYFMGSNIPDIGTVEILASWSLDLASPHLPETITEYANDTVFKMVDSNYVAFVNKQLPAFYSAGYTNAVFNVLEWTNVGPLKLPKRFSLLGYSPMPEGKHPKDLAIQVAYNGYIKTAALAASDEINLPLQFPKWTKILEFRYGLTNGQPFVYTSESGNLLAENELRTGVHILRKDQRAQELFRSRPNHLPKMILLSSFVVLTIAAVLFIYLNRKKD